MAASWINFDISSAGALIEIIPPHGVDEIWITFFPVSELI